MRKIRFSFAVVFTALYMAVFAFSVFGNDNIWISGNIRNAKYGDSIDFDDAPNLCFEGSSSHADNVNVQITLVGAQWRYDKEGTLSRGLNYSIENDNIMNLTIDSDAAGFYIQDIKIPFYVKLTGEGYIRVFVSTDDTTVGDFEDTLTTVKCDSKKLYAGSATKKMKFAGAVAFSVVDETRQSFTAGTKMYVSINNGFYFISANPANGTGKFENCCTFEISDTDPSKAVITITENTGCTPGKIGISNIRIQKEDKYIYSTAMVSVKMDDDDIYTSLSCSTAVAKYDSTVQDEEYVIPTISEKQTEITSEAIETTKVIQINENNNEAVIYDSSVTPENIITIPIGQSYYAVGDDVYDTDAPAYISKDNYTMLPLRAVANALGVDDSKILYNSKTFTATLIANDRTITITKGQKSIAIDGTPTPIDTAAEIKNSRLFVPVRAMANAFGINNSKIEYDSINRMVKIDTK